MTSLQALVDAFRADSFLVQRIGWTLLHSIWQGGVIAIGLALVLPFMRKRGAKETYGVCCGALFLAGLAPAVTFTLLPSTPTEIAATNETKPFALSGNAGNPDRMSAALPAGGMTPHDPSRSMTVADGTIPADPALSSVDSSNLLAPSAAGGKFQQADPEPQNAPHAKAGELSERFATARQAIVAASAAWMPWIVLAWGLGVLALSLWNLGGWLAVERMKSRGTERVAAAIEAAAERIARQLGLVRGVRLLQSALVDSPLVIGVVKPVILLPASLVTALPADELESLLAHELAHVLRQDYLVNLLQSAVETLLFYHPAVWWISAQVRREREDCCDDIAVRLVKDRTIYVRALAAVAGARVPALTPAAAGGLLLPRLRRVLGLPTPRASHPAWWLAGAALFMTGITIAGGIALDARPAKAVSGTPPTEVAVSDQEPKETPKETSSEESGNSNTEGATEESAERAIERHAKTKGSMQIEVVDPHGEPLENARVFASIWTDEKQFKANREYMSDAKGIARIELPKTLTILRLWVSKPGHSALFINFSTDEREAKPLVIPESLTFRLLKGTVMGGIVKNDEGKGIEGVRIQTRYDGGGVKLDGAFNHSLDDKVVTDADGRWRLDTVPPGEKVQIRLELEHPDYISHQPWREVQRAQKVTSEALRSEASVIVMQYGNSVTGTVTAQGQPVENAVVIWGDHPYWEQGPQEVRTNSKGVYRFPPLPTGPMRVTVVAEGWSPDSRRIEITPKPPATDFALRRGKKLRIRFVDQRGAPVPDVYVSIENWRGAEALYNHKHPDVIDVKIPHLADKEGVFEWGWAPDDGVTYRFSKVGFAETTATITAGDSEQTQTLQPVLRFAGSVRDAATGQPIDDFLAIPVIYFRPDFPLLDRSHAVRQKGGRLNLELDRTDIEHGVQVEAAGYEMYRSPQRHSIGSALPELDIRLKRAAKFLGKVMDAEGRPVSGARVYVATQFQHLDLQRLKDRDGNQTHNYSVNTAADGTFEIIPPIERYALVVIADLGYAEVERDVHNMPGDIRIQPWARVSGRLLQSGKPVSNHSVFLEPIRNDGVDQPRVNCDFQGHSEEDGTFVFENVPPIPCRVRAFVHFSRETPLRSGHSIPLQLSPGEQVQVELGTGGIDVTGQLVVENAPADFDYHFSLSYLVARKPGITPPAHLDARGFDWRKGWSDAWRGTQEGQAYLNTLHHWFVKPTPDGRILISGVEPGEYDFAVHLYGSTEGCLVHPVATRVIPVTVKPGQKELDLGRLVIPSLTLPKVGDMASDFEFTGLDGKRTSLGAHRGKYVLLDFWATWCSPCVAKLDAVEGLRRELAAENRLVVIGVNLDADIDRAKQFLGKRPLPWEHALLGEWSNTDVPARFAVSNVPTYILVGPDGRIVAHEYLFETVSTKLKKLMEGSAEDGKPGK